jgi:hypothetical protein
MADVINLKQARKARDRDARLRQAEANRRDNGRSKTERTLSTFDKDRTQREQQGRKITKDEEKD